MSPILLHIYRHKVVSAWNGTGAPFSSTFCPKSQIVIKHQFSLSWQPPIGLDCSFSLLDIMAKEKSIWDLAQIEGARLRKGPHTL